MKHFDKILYGICILISVVLLGLSIQSDVSRGEISLSFHTAVLVFSMLSFIRAFYKAKDELSSSEYKKRIIIIVAFIVAWYILFQLGIIP